MKDGNGAFGAIEWPFEKTEDCEKRRFALVDVFSQLLAMFSISSAISYFLILP